MTLADNCIIPPKEWYHNPLLRNEGADTVALILIYNDILPPKEWEHIIDKYDIYKDSSKEQFLLDNGYIEVNDCFIPPDFIVKETFNDIC